MNFARLLTSIKWDIRTQYHYGFYHVTVVMLTLWIITLSQLERKFLVRLLPVFILTNLNMGTFVFIGGILLFEKSEHTLDGLILTPLKFKEYLGAKVVSLTILALIENVTIIIIVYRKIQLDFIGVLLGTLAMAVLYTLFGFGFVLRYNTINEYLAPAVLAISYLQIPALQFFGIDSLFAMFFYYLTPMQPPILLLEGRFWTLSLWKFTVAILGSSFWLVVAYVYAKQQYTNYILRRVNT